MPRKCSVPGCGSAKARQIGSSRGKTDKYTLFGAPKDAEKRRKWMEILNCQLHEKSLICEKHFRKSDYGAGYYGEYQGQFILQYDFKSKRLKKDVFPISNNSSDDVASITENIKNNDINRNLDSSSMPHPSSEVIVGHSYCDLNTVRMNMNTSLKKFGTSNTVGSTSELFDDHHTATNNEINNFSNIDLANRFGSSNTREPKLEVIDEYNFCSTDNEKTKSSNTDLDSFDISNSTEPTTEFIDDQNSYETETNIHSPLKRDLQRFDICLTQKKKKKENFNIVWDMKVNVNNVNTDSIQEKDNDNMQNCNLGSELYSQLRETLLHTNCQVTLPNQSWIFYKNEKTECIIFAYCEEIPANSLDPKVARLEHKKTVTLGESEIALVISNTWIDKNHKLYSKSKPETIQELEKILSRIDNYNVCIGGPPTTQYTQAHSECAYKDGKYWRHKNCDWIMDNCHVCSKCCTLHPTLSRAIDREIKRNCNKRIRLTGGTSSQVVRKMKQMLWANSNARRVITRVKKKNQELSQQLEEAQEKLRYYDDNYAQTLLKKESSQ